jgi:hypothetical protein
MSNDENYVWFKLSNGVTGSYTIMSRDGDHQYRFSSDDLEPVKVREYDAFKLRTFEYLEEVDKTGIAKNTDTPERGPADNPITSNDIGGVTEDESPNDYPEEAPETPEEPEEKLEDESVIEVEDVLSVDSTDDVDFSEKDRGSLVSLASKFDYDGNPAHATNDELIEFLNENT